MAWGRARGCSERQHPFTASAGRAEEPVMPTCAHIWEGGKKERAGIFLEGLGGAELALVAQAAGKGASVMLKLVIALLQTTGHKLLPLCESATACPVCLVCCCSPETKGSAFPKPPIPLFLPSPGPGGFGCCRDHSKGP